LFTATLIAAGRLSPQTLTDAVARLTEEVLALDAAGPSTFKADPGLADQWQLLFQTLDGPANAANGGGLGGLGDGTGSGGGGRVPNLASTPNLASADWTFGRGRGGRGTGRGGRGMPLSRGEGGRGGASVGGPTPLRPYGVWLPGLKRVAHLLNGTAGVRHVASSKVHRKLPNGATSKEADGEAGATEGGAASAAAPEEEGAATGAAAAAPGVGIGSPWPNVSSDGGQLIIRIDGAGNYGAHRLLASYRDASSYRTQLLFVSCEDYFPLGELREVLRALQPVLNFVLEDGGDRARTEVPF
jgi:hypothetical protein